MRIITTTTTTTTNFLKSLHNLHFLRLSSSLSFLLNDKPHIETPHGATYSPDNEHIGNSTLATDLASLLEEPQSKPKPKSRMELKRFLELRIKKRVKEQHANGKFHNLMKTVISNAETLRDAYHCIRINSNALDAAPNHDASFLDDLAEELGKGDFDVCVNTSSFSTRKGSANKEILVLPNLKLKVVQEAMRIALEVVYKPHFSKISHGCRSGRGRAAALKYICKGVLSPDWWFSVLAHKKLDAVVLEKLISIMEDKIEDPWLYGFIRSMFDARVLNLEFGGFPKGHGLPQEGVLSPILMNIYLDLFDSEFCRLSMKYEGICDDGGLSDPDRSGSMLRGWFRRQLDGVDARKSSGVKVYSCRYMDEMFFAVSGSRDAAVNFMSEVQSYLKSSLLLDVGDETDILPCEGPHSIRFLGTLVRRTARESPAVKAVHKLKEKVELFTMQKVEAWEYGTVRIGKKWLGHGLKKVKESEIRHLADSSSLLNRVSCFRKSGMKTDHWYKHLLKIWMQDVQAKTAQSKENILSKCIAEPALPQELKDSFYEFIKQAEQYISAEADSILKLLPNNNSSTEHPIAKTEIIAPIHVIKMRLLRYGLTTTKGFPRSANLLIMLDTTEIIDWFSGISCRWLKWYENCSNFDEIKLLISDDVRKSCIRTLAAKYRVHETEIEKRFDVELSRIPSIEDADNGMINEASDVQAFENDEALTYGIAYSGLCLLSLARIVTKARPCNCFVIGCSSSAPRVYTLHVMERQKSPSWKTGFSTCIHPSLNKRRVGLCKQHLRDLYLGHISLQSIDFGAWK
ncbi:nuclear intron maturase 4, mitochondrial [Cajanus cajan]|uniref:nuclear intron maturase 4, mitochondrial n=1 Tax=Cajanus cajan TaxID=3821 RepID=UPI00098DBE20|nr:nuclear intron maturase 4, mitochondrial [Cajanus cajan]XP_020227303.1 nuclear intron maturase 4, mitochondrial [Cajanus cajan]XP_020227304.1 nuclear intron maturase 4, mitochondrial [Cajanus cajan]XP_020227305.1 nuclear intron maturase 4, mitochondrial [Cajanus cajan]XP_020227306.1 nuclear intron maturase 4, mitochondrial [Cajanus cajan]XP_020227308.1 nuclear intron maturase 4, mitochondrial [Cajanus cajan]XP_020227309.1 nuclear intron maturase 4, mitochondrial [Cajanus cajan]XP_02022731